MAGSTAAPTAALAAASAAAKVPAPAPAPPPQAAYNGWVVPAAAAAAAVQSAAGLLPPSPPPAVTVTAPVATVNPHAVSADTDICDLWQSWHNEVSASAVLPEPLAAATLASVVQFAGPAAAGLRMVEDPHRHQHGTGGMCAPAWDTLFADPSEGGLAADTTGLAQAALSAEEAAAQYAAALAALAAAPVPAPSLADTCKTAAGVPVTLGAGDTGTGGSFGPTATAGGLVTAAGISVRPAGKPAASSSADAAAESSTDRQKEQHGNASSAWGTNSLSSSRIAAGGLVTSSSSSTSSKFSPRAGSLAERLGLPQSAAATYAPFVSAIPFIAPDGSKGSSSRLLWPVGKGSCAMQVLQEQAVSVPVAQLLGDETCMGVAAATSPGLPSGAAASLLAYQPAYPPAPAPAPAVDPKALLHTAAGRVLLQRLAVRWLLPNWAAVSWLQLVLQQLLTQHVELLLEMPAGKPASTFACCCTASRFSSRPGSACMHRKLCPSDQIYQLVAMI